MSQALKIQHPNRAISRVSSLDDVAIAITTAFTTALTQQQQQIQHSSQQPELWNLLPVEVKELVVSFFDYKSLCAGSQVSHELKFFCDNEKLWEKLCKEQLQISTKHIDRCWKWVYKCRVVPFQKGKQMTFGFQECTEEPKGIYFGEFENDVFHGSGFFEWAQHGLKYMGQYQVGLRHGCGILTWKNGDRYVGEFQQDMKHGRGTFFWSNNDVYCGDYVQDKKQGRGCITWGSHPGEKYDGEWHNDKKQGFGKYVWANGGSYEGYWLDNKRNGKGIEKWPSGSIYDGSWVENEMHGWGHKICTRDGRPDGFYEGPFQDGRAHGRGYRQYEDGSTYEGDYAADKRVGFGSYTWKDGEKFSGIWAVGRDKGFLISTDGTMFYQEWQEDKLREDERRGPEQYQVTSTAYQQFTTE